MGGNTKAAFSSIDGVEPQGGPYGSASAAAVSVGAGSVCPLTATHFSFLPSSLTAGSSVLSDSSSDVTLSSVSASTPVVSDSELELDEEDSLVEVAAAASAEGVSVGVVAALVTEESLFAAASRRAFLALARASFLSSF